MPWETLLGSRYPGRILEGRHVRQKPLFLRKRRSCERTAFPQRSGRRKARAATNPACPQPSCNGCRCVSVCMCRHRGHRPRVPSPKAFFYGVAPRGPWMLASVAIVVLVVTLLATYFPARRQPSRSLRGAPGPVDCLAKGSFPEDARASRPRLPVELSSRILTSYSSARTSPRVGPGATVPAARGNHERIFDDSRSSSRFALLRR
jgi:hypothetical protein